MQIKRKIEKLMRKSTYSPSTRDEILKHIGPKKGTTEKSINRALDQLLTEGRIVKDKQGRFYIPKAAEVIGTFEANKKGFGFVITDDFDVYVKSSNISGAMNHDLVKAEIIRRRKNLSFEGKIIQIIERSITKIIGRLELKGNKQIVIPADRRLNYQFDVVKPVDEKPGTIVSADINQYPVKGIGRCTVTEVIGDEDDPAVEIEMIIREHDLRRDFPEEVMCEVQSVPHEVSKEEADGRVDYRDDYVVTIDGLDAKDFDDAIQIEKNDNFYELKVHIADVDYYVKPHSNIDVEANSRSFSTYLADRVLPMLPHALSNNICSLNPGVDRLTMSVEMTINKNGTVESYSINEGVIKSKARLTYTEVDESIKTGKFKNSEQKKTILLMAELSDILEEKRTRTGSVNFETIEPKVVFDGNEPKGIDVREKTPATKLIEEAMVLTNEVVASFVYDKKLPLIYRIHEDPDEDAFEEVRQILGQLGYPSKKMSKATAEAFQNIIRFAHKRQERLIINSILLRLMKKARYSTLTAGHFGLGLKHYSHFTSPIRRYPDLLTHRQVKAVLKSQKPLDEEKLTEFAQYATLREVESDSAERESTLVYICKLMKEEVGEVYNGVISGVTNFGLFVQLPNSAEGLIHISNLKGDYYRFEPERFVLRGLRTGQTFRLGQSVRIKLVSVVVGERQIDLMLA